MSDDRCSEQFCPLPQTHHSATTIGFTGSCIKYKGYCEKHAKIRWLKGYHMMKMEGK